MFLCSSFAGQLRSAIPPGYAVDPALIPQYTTEENDVPLPAPPNTPQYKAHPKRRPHFPVEQRPAIPFGVVQWNPNQTNSMEYDAGVAVF